jgi:uncharacterized membrane protein YkoI
LKGSRVPSWSKHLLQDEQTVILNFGIFASTLVKRDAAVHPNQIEITLIMKHSKILTSLLALAALATCNVSTACSYHCQHINQSPSSKGQQSAMAALLPQAKVSKASATKSALAAVPNGTLKEDAELEKENGKLVWSFDISKPGTTSITEIMVDAVTGTIVSNEQETPKDQRNEAAADKKEKGW